MQRNEDIYQPIKLNRMKYKISTLLVLFLFTPALLLAQKITVSGTVEDENNLPPSRCEYYTEK